MLGSAPARGRMTRGGIAVAAAGAAGRRPTTTRARAETVPIAGDAVRTAVIRGGIHGRGGTRVTTIRGGTVGVPAAAGGGSSVRYTSAGLRRRPLLELSINHGLRIRPRIARITRMGTNSLRFNGMSFSDPCD